MPREWHQWVTIKTASSAAIMTRVTANNVNIHILCRGSSSAVFCARSAASLPRTELRVGGAPDAAAAQDALADGATVAG